MKNIKLLLACALCMAAVPVLAGMNDDPEMSHIDTSPDRREQPPAGTQEGRYRAGHLHRGSWYSTGAGRIRRFI